jgi:hypothetical protein
MKAGEEIKLKDYRKLVRQKKPPRLKNHNVD